MTNTKSARVGGEYKYVSGKWKTSVWGVDGKWSDKYIYENNFFDYLNAHEHAGASIAHLPGGGGGAITFEMGKFEK